MVQAHNPSGGMLLDFGEVEQQPVKPAKSKTIPRTQDKPPRKEVVAPPPWAFQEARVLATLRVEDGYWYAEGRIQEEVLELKGVTTGEAVKHAGVLRAALEVLWLAKKQGIRSGIVLRTEDCAAVGFMVVTLPDHLKPNHFDEDKDPRGPWPDLYREFLDLYVELRPLIQWQFPFHVTKQSSQGKHHAPSR